MCYLDDFAKNFSSAVGFFFDGSPGAPRPGPRPLFCRQKRGEKTASPPVPGAGPRAIRGVYGGFLRCRPGEAKPRQVHAPSGQIGGPLTPPVGLLTRENHLGWRADGRLGRQGRDGTARGRVAPGLPSTKKSRSGPYRAAQVEICQNFTCNP